MDNIFANNPTWAIGIILVLFGIIAAHRLVSYRDRKNIFNSAAKEFVDTIHMELKEIYPSPANWPEDIDYYLRYRFDNLSEAVGKFRRHLPIIKRKSFDEAWFRFYCSTGREVDINCQVYHHYMSFRGVSVVNGKEYRYDNSKTYKDNLRNNVDNLLNYAKQK